MSPALPIRSQATQYDDTHEWFERCGVHGRLSQRARFGSVMNAVTSSSCPISSGAPIAKRRRTPGGTPAVVTLADAVESRRNTIPVTPVPMTAATVALTIDPVSPAIAVNATIA